MASASARVKLDPVPDVKLPAHLYHRISHMTVSEYVDLTRELIRSRLDHTVPELTPEIDSSADALEQVADAAEAALHELGDRYDSAAEALEVNFEKNADDIAAMFESALDFWSIRVSLLDRPLPKKTKAKTKAEPEPKAEPKAEQGSDAPETEAKPDAPEAKPDAPETAAKPDKDTEEDPAVVRELARQARAVYVGVFGEDGLDYARMPYAKRFHMLMGLLRTLNSDALGVDVEALLMRPYTELLPIITARYEKDLAEHLAIRDDSHGLAEHRAALRMALAEYVHLLREAPDRWSKESCDRVNTALIPLEDRCRALNRRH